MAQSAQYNLKEAKNALDAVIKKSRIHLYKPIQIAEILYRDRIFGDIDLADLETYRNKSKAWRDEMCIALLGRVSTSSAKFQDDLFNAIPPRLLSTLGAHNKNHNGNIEAYIYNQFLHKYTQLKNALSYCINADKETFNIKEFIDLFWREAGLKRSIDKIYEIITYALFESIIQALELQINISINPQKLPLLKEFSDFAKSVIGIDRTTLKTTQKAHFYRLGVTNAADRGLDMYANFGVAVQIKHLSLEVQMAQNIASSVRSDKIIIVCKDAERDIIESILTQIGYANKIISIITESDLINWYEKALRGKFANELSDEVLKNLQVEIMEEFPPTKELPRALKDRHYEVLNSKESIFNILKDANA